MVQKKVALPAIGAGAIIAGGLFGRRLVSQWRKNPDPLDGVPVAFPDGDVRIVTTPDGAQISTVTSGTGPTVVCVHGLTASRHDWGPIAPRLINEGYQVVAVEQRGHGDSTPGTAGYGSTQLGRDLATVFTELDLHAVALVGHSMGGMAAMGFAAHEREIFDQRVDRLVLIATAASLQSARDSAALRIGSIPIPDVVHPADKRLRVGTGLGIFGRRPSLHMIDEAIRSFRNCPEEVRQQATAGLVEHDVRTEMSTLDLPVLVLGASRDQLVRPSQVEELAELIDGSQLHMFEGAGHMVIWERHSDISNLVIDFLGPLHHDWASGEVHQPLHEPT